VKLAVEEAESQALLASLEAGGPRVTSVVGEIETVRVCRRAGVPAEKVDEVTSGIALVALDDEVRRLAAAVVPTTLSTLDAIHLATAVSLARELDALLTYDLRLADAARGAGLTVAAPG
jgi:uncharacterized protein